MFYLFAAMNIYIICIKIRNGEQKKNKGLKKTRKMKEKEGHLVVKIRSSCDSKA